MRDSGRRGASPCSVGELLCVRSDEWASVGRAPASLMSCPLLACCGAAEPPTVFPSMTQASFCRIPLATAGDLKGRTVAASSTSEGERRDTSDGQANRQGVGAGLCPSFRAHAKRGLRFDEVCTINPNRCARSSSAKLLRIGRDSLICKASHINDYAQYRIMCSGGRNALSDGCLEPLR